MFYKIGFWVLLVALIACLALFLRTNPMKRQGAMSWIDIYSTAPTATIEFLNKNFGISVVSSTPTGGDQGGEYRVIKTAGQVWPFAGVMDVPTAPSGEKGAAGAMIYLTAKDFEATRANMLASGARETMGKTYAGGMWFGIYEIPGGVTIGVAQYERVPEMKEDK